MAKELVLRDGLLIEGVGLGSNADKLLVIDPTGIVKFRDLSEDVLDGRYVMKSGDTMTGDLVIENVGEAVLYIKGDKNNVVADNNTPVSTIAFGSDGNLRNAEISYLNGSGIGSLSFKMSSIQIANLTQTGNFSATSFIKSGGLATEFLKADGSVDSNTYLTSTTGDSAYVKKSGDTMTGDLTLAGVDRKLIYTNQRTFILPVQGTRVGILNIDTNSTVRLTLSGSENGFTQLFEIIVTRSSGGVIGLTKNAVIQHQHANDVVFSSDVNGNVYAEKVIYSTGRTIFIHKIELLKGTATPLNGTLTNVGPGIDECIDGQKWGYILNKPTTLSGYGITDGITQATANSAYVNVTGDTMTGDLTVQGLSNQAGIYDLDNGLIRVANPKGASLRVNGNPVIGAIKILLPSGHLNSMMKFTVDVYDYATDEMFSVSVGGYVVPPNVGTASWVNTSVQIIGSKEDRDFTVRFGFDTTDVNRGCIWIGEVDSSWNNLNVGIHNVLVGFTQVTKTWAENWNIFLVTAFDTVQVTKTGNFIWGDWSKLKGKPMDLSGFGLLTEADNRYVNVTGDTMTGDLQVFKVAPEIHLANSIANNSESGRLRFSEAPDNLQGGWIRYDGANNVMYIGTTTQIDGTGDVNAITIGRGSTNITVSGDVNALKFIKSGGLSTQFLKADGSVDSNTYLTSYTNTTYTSSNGILLTGTNFAPTYGTAVNTIAQGNDSRINNGQTAFGWGNHASKYVLNTSSTQLDPNTQLQSSSYRFDPHVNNPTNTHYSIFTYGNNSNVTAQLATRNVTAESYIRNYNTSWSTWRKIWDDVNLTNVSQLNNDAGYLTSTTGDSAYVKKVGDTMTGDLLVSGAVNNTTPATDQVKLDGYGLIGARGILYFTNSGASIKLSVAATHNANNGIEIQASKVISHQPFFAKTIQPNTSDGLGLYGDNNDGTGRGANVQIGGNGTPYVDVTIGDTTTTLAGQFNVTNRSATTLGTATFDKIGDFKIIPNADSARFHQFLDTGYQFIQPNTLSKYTKIELAKIVLAGGSGGNHTLIIRQDGSNSPSYIDSSNTVVLSAGAADYTFSTGGVLSLPTGGGLVIGGKTADDVLLGNGTTTSLAAIGGGSTFDGGNISGNIGRTTHNSGFLVGGYNNIGNSATNTNPIFTIGSLYLPTTTTLGNMYGIGYTNSSASFINTTASGSIGAAGWGSYVSAGGTATIWLNATEGTGHFKGDLYSNGLIQATQSWVLAQGYGAGGGGTIVGTTNIALGIVPTAPSITNASLATNGDKSNTTLYTTFGSGTQALTGAQSAYMQIDLGFAADVLEHRIWFYDLDGRSYYYNMTYSTDGVNWTHAVGTSGNFILSDGVIDVPDTINLGSPITARYWRIFANGNTVNTANHLYEWEIYEGTGGGSYLPLAGGTLTGIVRSNYSRTYTPSSIGKAVGGIHLQPTATTNDLVSSITFSGQPNLTTEAQAGIYVQGSSVYGTKMVLATTSSHATGPIAGLSIDHLGNTVTRGSATATSFIKIGGTADDVLLGNGTTTSLAGISGGGGTTYTAGTDLTLAGTTFNVTSATASTINTIAKRDSSGDINARLFRSEYDTTNPTVGFIMTQIDTVSNNFIRPTTPTQFRAAVTDGSYPTKTGSGASGTWGISITGNAATADLIKINDYNSTTIMRLLGSHQTGGSDNVYSTAGVTMNCSTNAITATGGFYESSLREFKTNITPFTLSGLDLINELDVVTFDRNDSETKGKIGIIADDSPKEFLSNEEDAVDLYKTIFVQTKAIQELNNKVDDQQKQIDNLKELVNKLLDK